MTYIAVSILGVDKKIDALKILNTTDVDYIHLDIMDGKFVSNKTESSGEVSKILAHTNKKLDVHLMVNDPKKYIDHYSMLNTNTITIHVEIKNVSNYLKQIKSYGLKCGLAINPDTDYNLLKPYLDDINQILIMSVEPGSSGQTFIESTYDKIDQIKELIKDHNIILAIDGGINDTNNIECINRGINMICSGSYITNSNNYKEQIKNLRG